MKVKNVLQLMRSSDRVCVMEYEPKGLITVSDFHRGSVETVKTKLTKAKKNPEVISIQCQGSELIIHASDYKQEIMDNTGGIGIFV